MKAMILAAGRGRRMRHLTEAIPKPLVSLKGKTLLESQIDRLVQAGITEILINVAYLGHQIIKAIGFGDRWGIKIAYSVEPEPLETGGGITRALAFLDDTFLVVNSDITTDFDYKNLLNKALNEQHQAHLILIQNPEHNLKGDFSLHNDIPTTNLNSKTYTFAGIGLYHRSLFNGFYPGCNAKLPDIWKNAMAEEKITAEIYQGKWADIGTPERLNIYE